MTDEEFTKEIHYIFSDYFKTFEWLNNSTSSYILVRGLKLMKLKHPHIWNLFMRYLCRTY